MSETAPWRGERRARPKEHGKLTSLSLDIAYLMKFGHRTRPKTRRSFRAYAYILLNSSNDTLQLLSVVLFEHLVPRIRRSIGTSEGRRNRAIGPPRSFNTSSDLLLPDDVESAINASHPVPCLAYILILRNVSKFVEINTENSFSTVDKIRLYLFLAENHLFD